MSWGVSNSSTAPSEVTEHELKHELPPSPYCLEIFTREDLLVQPFLPELRTIINASYRDHDINPIGKIGHRIQHDTQIVDEIGANGFTAIVFASDEIVGTASVRDWMPDADGVVWKLGRRLLSRGNRRRSRFYARKQQPHGLRYCYLRWGF